MLRKTFETDVPVEWDGDPWAEGSKPVSWMGWDLKTTKAHDDRAVFRFHLWPSGMEEAKIEARVDEVAGGIAATVDLQRGIANTRTAIYHQLGVRIWGEDGRPVTDDVDESAAHQKLIEAGWLDVGRVPVDHEDIEGLALVRRKDAFMRMTNLRERQEIYACWPTLIISPPEGWEDMAVIDMAPTVRDRIIQAFRMRQGAAEEASGK